MSNFTKEVRNPFTGKIEEATFLDNYFGSREYGVKFKSGLVYRESEIKRRTISNRALK